MEDAKKRAVRVGLVQKLHSITLEGMERRDPISTVRDRTEKEVYETSEFFSLNDEGKRDVLDTGRTLDRIYGSWNAPYGESDLSDHLEYTRRRRSDQRNSGEYDNYDFFHDNRAR